MYRNIVFDLGGVVVDFDPKNFLLERFFDTELEDKVYNIVFGSTEWQMLDAGEITREDAYAIMLEKAKESGCVFEVQSVLDDWPRILKTRRKTVEIMQRLKNMGFSLYYLSNIAEDTLEDIKSRDFWPLFDGGVASCELRANKPNPILYETLLSRYNLNRAETIFTDDNKVNTSAAYDLGITGIHYKGTASFIRALNQCGIPIKERTNW